MAGFERALDLNRVNRIPPRTGSFEDFADGASGDIQLERRMLAVYDEAFRLWQARHRKYGRGNISSDSALGCQVRLGDKVARLREFYQNNRGGEATDETIDDTWLDAINYPAMGLVCRRGQWPGAKPDTYTGTATVRTPRGVAHDATQLEIPFVSGMTTNPLAPGRVIHVSAPPEPWEPAPCGCHDAFESGVEAPKCDH